MFISEYELSDTPDIVKQTEDCTAALEIFIGISAALAEKYGKSTESYFSSPSGNASGRQYDFPDIVTDVGKETVLQALSENLDIMLLIEYGNVMVLFSASPGDMSYCQLALMYASDNTKDRYDIMKEEEGFGEYCGEYPYTPQNIDLGL